MHMEQVLELLFMIIVLILGCDFWRGGIYTSVDIFKGEKEKFNKQTISNIGKYLLFPRVTDLLAPPFHTREYLKIDVYCGFV